MRLRRSDPLGLPGDQSGSAHRAPRERRLHGHRRGYLRLIWLWVHRRGYHSDAEIRSELAGIRGLDVEASAHPPAIAGLDGDILQSVPTEQYRRLARHMSRTATDYADARAERVLHEPDRARVAAEPAMRQHAGLGLHVDPALADAELASDDAGGEQRARG